MPYDLARNPEVASQLKDNTKRKFKVPVSATTKKTQPASTTVTRYELSFQRPIQTTSNNGGEGH